MFESLTSIMAASSAEQPEPKPAEPMPATPTPVSPTAAAPGETVSVEDFHVHLLGRSISGPFAETDDEGGPIIEVYEMVDGTDRRGRSMMKPSLIGSFDRGTTRGDLVNADDEDLGRRWYRVLVRGADGRPLASEDVDLRPPASQRRRTRRRSGREQPAQGTVGWLNQRDRQVVEGELQARIDAAVDREVARRTGAHEQLVAALKRECEGWQTRAEAAEKEVRALRDQALDLKIKVATLQAGGQAAQPFDLDQLGAMVEKARTVQDMLEGFQPSAPEASPARPSLPKALLGGLGDLKTAVSDITELGTALKGVGGGFSFSRG